MDRRNFLSSLAVLAFFVFFYVLSGGLAENARYWPKLVCVIGGAISAANSLIALVKMSKAPAGGAIFPLTAPQMKRFAGVTAVAVLWAAGIMTFSYLISSAVATLVLVLAFEPIRDFRHICRDVVVTLLFSGMSYGLFTLLGVQFPEALII